MKGRSFCQRLGFAWRGIVATWRREASFRSHTLAAVGVGLVGAFLQPPLYWLALLLTLVVLVLAAELFNTALEESLDGLHPQAAEFVRRAKDAAAAAVLVLSLGAAGCMVLLVIAWWKGML